MSHYDSLDAYNADVIAAREAYAADMHVQNGYCETGDGRRTDNHRHRRCSACRARAARERAAS